MTGQLVLTSDGATVFAGGHRTPSMLRPMPNATTRAVFRLGPACCLYYNDAWRFGWIRPAGLDPCRTDPFLRRLGSDPLGGNFTPAALQRALARHPRTPVKAVLLRPDAIAGIGNIYADEVRHRARIHPSRPAGGLSQAEALRLHAAIHGILRGPRHELLPALPATLKLSRRPGSCREAASRHGYGGRATPAAAEGDAVYSKIKIAGHPAHPMLVAFLARRLTPAGPRFSPGPCMPAGRPR
jgi:formamidopyrimidine-DNA glycosylase